MKKHNGFTLIELVMFILITSILASSILLSYVGALGNSPTLLQNTIASQTVKQCAEWYLAQRRLNGYSNVSGAHCTNPLTINGFCTKPAGYTLTGTCAPTTVRGDTNYETITLSVGGNGSASLSFLLGKY